MSVSIIGILDDGWAGLADAARQALQQAELVIGVGRTLELVRPYLAQADLRDMDGALTRCPEWIKSALASGQSVAVLATGDPLCHGIATYLLDKLPLSFLCLFRFHQRVHPEDCTI